MSAKKAQAVEGAAAPPNDALRLDKWLWSARFFKTRQLAIDAVNAGRVTVNGERAKPAKMLKAGDELLVRKPPYEQRVKVQGIAPKRGSASIAQTLYEETAESRAAREALAAEMKTMPPPIFKGRPTKRDRRLIDRMGFDEGEG
jgi:ribosome-associated heat shock protein Hsp15